MEYISHWMIAPHKIENRAYQQNISNTCSQKNTLVILPTALGKTIIAMLTAIKRLDVYPWAKIVFLAPTRPLALQHYNTFSELLIFDENKTNMLTGKNIPQQRASLWEQSQFIFATPQVIQNDLENNRYSLNDVALLIIDEAHRARKNYAYTKIAYNFIRNNKDPIILALTASPGKNKERIEEICNHLFIETIESRSEQDPDVREYVNPIQLDWYKLKLPREYVILKKDLEEILFGYLKKLRSMKFFMNTPINRISKMDLINFGNKIRIYLDSNLDDERKKYYFSALSIQAASISLMHALELLTTQEIETFLNFLNKIEQNSSEQKNKFSQRIVNHPKFKILKARTELYSCINHSKMNKLIEIISDEIKSNNNSRIIIFTQFRGTASKIVEKLQTLPDVNPIRFVGQASSIEDTGLSQTEQAEIIDDFRFGKYNVLVATSIAEEGLDIPSVELVIFYEPIPSEIRLIQRRGRTGRKKFGKVKILITENTLDEAYFYAFIKREREMKLIVSQLERNLKAKIERKSLQKPVKKATTPYLIKIKKNQKKRKVRYQKPQNVKIHPGNFDLKLEKGDVTSIQIKQIEGPLKLLSKPIKTKGLSNAVKWVVKKSSEIDNGKGIEIDEILKISVDEGFDSDLILSAISQLILEGVLFQPDTSSISIIC
ncbi:MAG: DEAD/DEAH box helicase [Candidatus Helarchaeota archaeon]